VWCTRNFVQVPRVRKLQQQAADTDYSISAREMKRQNGLARLRPVAFYGGEHTRTSSASEQILPVPFRSTPVIQER
jgi:hypothetical protein